MARINIEEEWWTDPRRLAIGSVIKNQDKADGQWWRLVHTAQSYWCDHKHPRSLIPKNIFTNSLFHPVFIKIGLVIEKEGGFYLSGSEKHFEWFHIAIKASSRGGKRSAEVRAEKYGTALPINATNNRSASEVPSEVKPKSHFGLEPKCHRSETEPSSLFPLSSSSLTTKLNTNTKKGKKAESTIPDGMDHVISSYCNAFKSRYKVNPLMTPKDIAQVRQIIKSVGYDRAITAVQVYCQMDDPWFKKKNHDLQTLIGNMQKVLVALNTGSDPDRKDDPFSFFNKGKEIQL